MQKTQDMYWKFIDRGSQKDSDYEDEFQSIDKQLESITAQIYGIRVRLQDESLDSEKAKTLGTLLSNLLDDQAIIQSYRELLDNRYKRRLELFEIIDKFKKGGISALNIDEVVTLKKELGDEFFA